MEVTVRIINYRCFHESQPAEFTLKPGFTAIVGENNAGKSAVLRFFYQLRRSFAQLVNVVEWNGSGSLDLGEYLSDQSSVKHQSAVGRLGFEVVLPRQCFTFEYYPNSGWRLARYRGETGDIAVAQIGAIDNHANLNDTNSFLASNQETFEVQSVDGNKLVVNANSVRRALYTLAQTFYIPSTRGIAEIGGANVGDILAGTFSVEKWAEMSTGSNSDSRRQARQLIERVRRLLNFDTLEISKGNKRDTLLVSTEPVQSLTLSEFGTGTEQVFSILLNLAGRKPRYILIDEPELSLHPRLQLTLMQALAECATDGVVFTTHNLGLARSVAQTIYSVRTRKHTRGTRFSSLKLYEHTTNLAEFLGSLSFAAHHECGVEHVLLVEGRTEVLTFMQWLRLYQLDAKVLLMPLGGDQLINDTSVLGHD